MPAKPKFSRDEVIKKAFEIVRESGIEKVSARTIATRLKSSPQPIYSHFSSMEELQDLMIQMARDVADDYMLASRTGDRWLDHGFGYVLFSREEPKLFDTVFKRLTTEGKIKYGKDFQSIKVKKQSGFYQKQKALKDHPDFQGLDNQEVLELRRMRWLVSQGLASPLSDGLPEEVILKTLENTTKVLVAGVRALKKKSTDLQKESH